jgi:hypothetical protein
LPASPIPKDPSTFPFISIRTLPAALLLRSFQLVGGELFLVGDHSRAGKYLWLYPRRMDFDAHFTEPGDLGIFFPTEMHNDIFGPFALRFSSPRFHFSVTRAFLPCTISCLLPCEAFLIAGRVLAIGLYSGNVGESNANGHSNGIYCLLDKIIELLLISFWGGRRFHRAAYPEFRVKICTNQM